MLVADDDGRDPRRPTGDDGVLLTELGAGGPGGAGRDARRRSRRPRRPALPAPEPARTVAEPVDPAGRDAAKARSPSAAPPAGAAPYLVLDGGDAAGSGLAVPSKVAQGLSARAYLYTDRPAYRPGQRSRCAASSARSIDGQYANVPGADVQARSQRQPGPAVRRPRR